MVMSGQKREQKQRYLKAKVAMALYSEYGRVPKEAEIDHVYHLTRVLYKAMLGAHFCYGNSKSIRDNWHCFNKP